MSESVQAVLDIPDELLTIATIDGPVTAAAGAPASAAASPGTTATAPPATSPPVPTIGQGSGRPTASA